ncbi:MAG: HAMP domain-containing protein [Thermodesulfobacteriota bacterium]
MFIKKRFQADFSIRFLILIIVESLLAIALFGYLSRGTVITGYSGSEVVIAKTGEYLLPTLLLVNLIIIGGTAVAGFVILLYLSHKIAGPLYRFEKSLDEIGDGDLTHRFTLRSKDQLGELAAKMNAFNDRLEGAISGVQRELDGLRTIISSLQSGLGTEGADTEALKKRVEEAKEKIEALERSVNYFKTSESRKR